jgi:hypothetical protein
MNMALGGSSSGIQSIQTGKLLSMTARRPQSSSQPPGLIGNILNGNNGTPKFGALTENAMAMNTGQAQRGERSKHSDMKTHDEMLTERLGMSDQQLLGNIA